MSAIEPLRGDELAAYEAAAASLEQTLVRLPDAAIVEVFANFVVRVALHGAREASRIHNVPSAVARGIEVGLFHSTRPSNTRGRDG
ncbi:MAG: hypothetical protein K0V04_09025 [Deltaproteobacteria bacterium]|nr:hypothetical protein [Deltaproteobacteria bacterium]